MELGLCLQQMAPAGFFTLLGPNPDLNCIGMDLGNSGISLDLLQVYPSGTGSKNRPWKLFCRAPAVHSICLVLCIFFCHESYVTSEGWNLAVPLDSKRHTDCKLWVTIHRVFWLVGLGTLQRTSGLLGYFRGVGSEPGVWLGNNGHFSLCEGLNQVADDWKQEISKSWADKIGLTCLQTTTVLVWYIHGYKPPQQDM